MLSFFNMIQSAFNYVNLNVVLKNRVYTVLAAIGNFYLLYVAFKFYVNGYWLRGTLFILAFLLILYFSYLNLLYYFTKDKKSKFDISPWIEKKLHIQAKDPMDDDKLKQFAGPGYVQTNGIFRNEDFLPATVTHSKSQQQNIQEVAHTLVQMKYLKLDYGGLNDKEIEEKIHQSGKSVSALSTPVALPYFELVKKGNSLVISGGVNQIQRQELGTIKDVGLLTATEAQKRYHLYLATAVITGGPKKDLGRMGVITQDCPFTLNVQVAYRKREVPLNSSSLATDFTDEQTPLTRHQHEELSNNEDFSSQKALQKHWRTKKYH